MLCAVRQACAPKSSAQQQAMFGKTPEACADSRASHLFAELVLGPGDAVCPRFYQRLYCRETAPRLGALAVLAVGGAFAAARGHATATAWLHTMQSR